MPGMSGEVANLIVALKLDDSGFSGKLNNAAKQLKGMDAGLSQMSRGAGQVAGGLGKLATTAGLAAAGGLAAVVTTAVSFEDAFAGVRKTVEASDKEFQTLFDSFRQMSRESGIAFEEFARIGEIAGALGIDTESIDEFSLAISKGAVATGLTVDELADSMGRLGTILDLDESTYETFISTLVELGNKGASTEGEIIEIAKRFATTGAQAGLANDEILGLSSAISALGVEPEAAGSSLSRIMTNFITETANGSDKAVEFAKVSGKSFKEFSNTVRDDTLEAVLDFVDGLSELDKFSKFQALEAAGITNVRDRNAILAFADGIETVREQLGYAADEYGEVNAVNEEFRKRNETTAQQFKILKENIRDAGYTIGSELLPPIKEMTQDFVTFLNEPGTQAGIKAFAEDLAGGIQNLASELKGTDFSGIIGGMKIAAEVAKGAFDAFRALPKDVQQLAIAALVANKVTGGAVGQIAKGLGNLLLGGLKTIMAGNVTVVGKSVIGGGPGSVPGVPAAAGGGLLALLGTAAAAAAVLAVGTVVGEQIYKSLNPTGHGFNELLSRTPGRPASRQLADADIQALSEATGVPIDALQREMIPLLQAGNTTWSEVLAEVRAGNSLISAGLGQFNPANRGGTRIKQIGQFDPKNMGGTPIKAVLPDTAMQPVTTALNASLPPIRTSAMQQLAMQAQALSATRQLGPRIDRVANTPHRVNVNNNITVPVNISATVLANQLYRTTTSRSYSSQTSTNTGGI